MTPLHQLRDTFSVHAQKAIRQQQQLIDSAADAILASCLGAHWQNEPQLLDKVSYVDRVINGEPHYIMFFEGSRIGTIYVRKPVIDEQCGSHRFTLTVEYKIG